MLVILGQLLQKQLSRRTIRLSSFFSSFLAFYHLQNNLPLRIGIGGTNVNSAFARKLEVMLNLESQTFILQLDTCCHHPVHKGYVCLGKTYRRFHAVCEILLPTRLATKDVCILSRTSFEPEAIFSDIPSIAKRLQVNRTVEQDSGITRLTSLL